MKAALFRIARAVLLLFGGAFAVLLYFDSQPEVVPQQISAMKQIALTGIILASVIMNLLEFRREDTDNAPERGGVAVVLLTGLVATIALGWEAKAPSDFLLPGAVFLITLVIAGLLARFVVTHKGEIGEARFTTTDYSKADDC